MLAWDLIGFPRVFMRGCVSILQMSGFEEPCLQLTNDSEVLLVDEFGTVCSSVDIVTLPLFSRGNLGIKRFCSFCLCSHFQSKTI